MAHDPDVNWIGRIIAAAFVKAARLLAWVYYSTIRISGTEHIPSAGPTLIVANHANSLVDPVVLGLAVRRRVRYLAKGPLFEIPVVGGLLRWLGMIPVWRAVDDRSRMRENIKALGDAAQALAGGKAVGIFPEGQSHDLRKLEPLFAGTSRIALQALEAGADDLVILPVGINYSEKDLFRSSVWIQIGEPINARDFVEAHGGAAKAKKALGDEIGERLRSVIIHLEDPEWEPYLEDLEILDPGSERARGDVAFSLRQRWVIAGALNHFRVAEPEKVESIGRALAAHRTRLRNRGLRVRSVILRQPGWRRLASLVGRTIQMVLGFLPALAGTVHNLVPFLAERGVVRLIPRADRTTTALSRLAVGVVAFPIWYALVWWRISEYFLPWVAWAWTISMPFAGLYAMRYLRVMRVILQRWWAEARMLFDRGFLGERRRVQARIRTRIRTLSNRYTELRPPAEPARLPIYRRPALRWAVLWGTTVAAALLLVWAGIRAGFRNYTLPALTAPAFDLAALDADTLARAISTDEEVLLEVLGTLDDLESSANQFRGEFDAGRRSFLNPDDTDEIHRLMLTYLNCRNELLRLVWKYRAAGTLGDPQPRLRSSLLMLTSGCALYQSASRLVAMFGDAPNARRKLNEPQENWGIPAGMFDTIDHNLRDRENVRVPGRGTRPLPVAVRTIPRAWPARWRTPGDLPPDHHANHRPGSRQLEPARRHGRGNRGNQG
jgi:glycerol-3-phosphate O-acyltransferase/dihydroxyacetone phosphate acyltransferase